MDSGGRGVGGSEPAVSREWWATFALAIVLAAIAMAGYVVLYLSLRGH